MDFRNFCGDIGSRYKNPPPDLYDFQDFDWFF